MVSLITVTLNTAIDRVIHLPALRVGKVLEAETSGKVPAGKGINVARAVASLGYSVEALGFVGEESADLFQDVETERIRTAFTSVAGAVRENFSLIEREGGTTTHIKTPGYHVSQADINRFITEFQDRITPDSTVILSGSVPPGLHPDIYRDLVRICCDLQAVALLDTSGEALVQGVEAGPDLIAPNLAELRQLTGRDLEPDPFRIVRYLSEEKSGGDGRIAVTLGAKGALLSEAGGRTNWYGWVPQDIVGEIRNATGCGDAFLAGLAVAWEEERHPQDALRLAVACGTANLFTDAPGELDRRRIDEVLENVEVREI